MRTLSWRSASSLAASACAACCCAAFSKRSSLASSSAFCRASVSLRSRAASSASRDSCPVVSGLGTSGATAMTGVADEGPAVSASIDSAGFCATTLGGAAVGAGAPSSDALARSSDFSETAALEGSDSVLASCAGSGSFAGFACASGRLCALGLTRTARFFGGTTASACACAGGSALGGRGAASVKAKPLARACPADPWGSGSSGALSAGSVPVACADRITRRRSGTSARLSCHGKPMPGNPGPWPSKVRLSKTA